MENDVQEKCRIWKTAASIIEIENSYLCLDSLRAGGEYKIENGAIDAVRKLTPNSKLRLTNWLVEERRIGNLNPTINEITLQAANNFELYSPKKLVERWLLYVVSQSTEVGVPIQFGHLYGASPSKMVDLDDRVLFALAYIGCRSEQECFAILQLACEAGYLEKRPTQHPMLIEVAVTLRGYERYDELIATSNDSKTAFVAMWFSDKMQDAYLLGIEPAVLEAGYEAIRIDRKEHNNKIDDEIVAEIRRSKFVIADFTSEVVERQTSDGKPYKDTHARGGVYFEAGFAKGLGKEVIWTVREDVLPFVHFDTRQFAHIVWKDAADLRAQLSRRISATLGDGPNKKPI